MKRLLFFLIFLFAVSPSHALQWTTTPPTIELEKVATLADGGERWIAKSTPTPNIVPYNSNLPTVAPKLRLSTYIRRLGSNGSYYWAIASVALPVAQAILERYLTDDPVSGNPKYPGIEAVRDRSITLPDGAFNEYEAPYGTSYYVYILGGYLSTSSLAFQAAKDKQAALIATGVGTVSDPVLLTAPGINEDILYDKNIYRPYRIMHYVPPTHGTNSEAHRYYFLYPLVSNPPVALDNQSVSDLLEDCFTDSCLETGSFIREAITAADQDLQWDDPILDESELPADPPVEDPTDPPVEDPTNPPVSDPVSDGLDDLLDHFTPPDDYLDDIYGVNLPSFSLDDVYEHDKTVAWEKDLTISNHPIFQLLNNSGLNISGSECSVDFPYRGRTMSFSMCESWKVSTLNNVGNILYFASVLGAVMFIFAGSRE